MEINRLDISKEFLEKVKILAQAKTMLPADKLRQVKDLHRVTCECDFLPDGSLDYRVGDDTATHLHFKIEDGSIIIIEYKLGEWLQRIDIASGFANLLMADIESDFIKIGNNLLDKMQNAQDVMEKVKYAKKTAQLRPFTASGWGILSHTCSFAGLHKEAARAATIALNLEPYNATTHISLSIIYYTALTNSKCGESLGCTSGYARQVIEKHCREAMKLSKDAKLNTVAEEMMNFLHKNEHIEYIHGQAEFGTACELCELDPSDALDDITDSVKNTKTPKPPLDKPPSKEIAVKVWATWWEIFVRQYSQRCVQRWADECVQMKDYNDMKKVWLKAFEPLWLAGCELEKSIRLKETTETARQKYLKSGKLNADDLKSIEAGLQAFTKSSDEIASQVIANFRALQSQSIEATLKELPHFDQASLLGKLKRLIYDYRV
jgi:hypothetical protein